MGLLIGDTPEKRIGKIRTGFSDFALTLNSVWAQNVTRQCPSFAGVSGGWAVPLIGGGELDHRVDFGNIPSSVMPGATLS